MVKVDFLGLLESGWHQMFVDLPASPTVKIMRLTFSRISSLSIHLSSNQKVYHSVMMICECLTLP